MLIAATLLIVASLVIHFTREHLQRQVDRDISAVQASFDESPANRIVDADSLFREGREWLAVQPVPADRLIAISTTGAHDILQSKSNLGLDQIEGGSRLISAQEARWWRLDSEMGEVRALTVPLTRGNEWIGTLVIASSTGSVDATIAPLLVRIGWASGIGLLFAGFLGFAAVRRTLRHLTRMAKDVDAIQASGDLSKRVAHEGPQDEVGRLAAAFDRMLSRLEEAFRSQRRFVSDASHELRTPLTIVRGQLELLQEEIDSARGRRSTTLAFEELDRMRRIVEDLLLLARLDEGLKLDERPVEVELVLREALLRGMLIGRRNATVEAEQGVFAMADPERLHQVLTNLVTNAVKHAGEDAKLTISSQRQNGEVVIRVTDTGPGIPPEELSRIFHRMYRGKDARASSGGGAGLGLAIASSLTHAMGGTIGVSSVPGRGTTFTVRLPAARPSPRAPTPAAHHS